MPNIISNCTIVGSGNSITMNDGSMSCYDTIKDTLLEFCFLLFTLLSLGRVTLKVRVPRNSILPKFMYKMINYKSNNIQMNDKSPLLRQRPI